MEGRRRQPMMRIVLAPRENVNRTRTDRTKSGACRAAYQISSHRERLWRIFPPSSSPHMSTSMHRLIAVQHL